MNESVAAPSAPAPPRRTADGVAHGIRTGDRLSLARLLSWIEAGDPRAESVQAKLRPAAETVVVGITGAPGAGKSSLVSKVVGRLRAAGDTVAVIAVDPSSAHTGGALLGDRLRMTEHLADRGVYVRSMANRGRFGGLATAVPGAVRALQTYGFDWVLVETVGVGQVEIDIAGLADTVVLLVAPNSGDEVQAVKAGVVEIADVFVVNKCDQPDAGRTTQEITAAVRLTKREPGEWRPVVVGTSARDGTGFGELVEAIGKHIGHSRNSGRLDERRRRRRGCEWRSELVSRLVGLADELSVAERYSDLRERVADGTLSPAVAADLLVQDLPAFGPATD